MISTQKVCREVSCQRSLNTVACWISPVSLSVCLSVCVSVSLFFVKQTQTSPHVHVFISSSILCISTSGQRGPPLIHTVLVSQMLMMQEPSLSQTPPPPPHPPPHPPTAGQPPPSTCSPPPVSHASTIYFTDLTFFTTTHTNKSLVLKAKHGVNHLRMKAAQSCPPDTHTLHLNGIILRLLEVIRYLF